MQIPTWVYTLVIGGLGIGAVAFLTWLVISILDDIFKSKWRKQFEEDLKLAVKHSQPSWEQLSDIAASRNIKNVEIYLILQRLLREILTGRETDVASHQAVLEGYLNKIKEIEPFEGMPTEIRIHLERIKEQLDQDSLLLQPLTNQIRDLLTINEKDRRHQKYYTMGGFFVGFVGLIFAAFAYFYPYSNSSSGIPKVSSAINESMIKPVDPAPQKELPSEKRNQ